LPCGAQNMMCIQGTQARCSDGHWSCVPTSSSSSSVSSASSAYSCGANNIRCMTGYMPMCGANGWQCVRPTLSSSSSSANSCIAKCSDGYEYRTCTEDGHPINYFADPCMNHSSSASSVSSQSCGANPYLCMIGTMPQCTNGQWKCVTSTSSSSSVSSQSAVHITTLSPSVGKVWTKVVITGTGFARRNNAVRFDNSIVTRLRSLDGTHLTFRVPSITLHPCFLLPHGAMCKVAMKHFGAGTYDVSVSVSGDESNALPFTIK
jgi:hypothetical protein